MHKDAYHLIDDCHGARPEDVQTMKFVATEVHDSILEGISAIGSIMFWAGENENYGEEQAKRDMQKLGGLLDNISRLAAGAKTAEENLAYALRGAKQ